MSMSVLMFVPVSTCVPTSVPSSVSVLSSVLVSTSVSTSVLSLSILVSLSLTSWDYGLQDKSKEDDFDLGWAKGFVLGYVAGSPPDL